MIFLIFYGATFWSVHCTGTVMLDAIVENLPHEVEEENPDVDNLAWLAVPTLENQVWLTLFWEKTVISPVAGTTRDAIDVPICDTDGREVYHDIRRV